ncbi:thioredoxin family protein [Thiomicrorhabdus cannonii]|uniref:thioredoxin family protein n=1 Tax=Thiomicrorhabdus cannonii TaxID=2748011 RepID=UPI0015BF69C8|nr:thioredoxin fold domain-containing protein [Thiomicrorhabdus cannonii]
MAISTGRVPGTYNRLNASFQRLAMLFAALFWSLAAYAQSDRPSGVHGSFQELQDCQLLGQESRAKKLPIVLMFGAQWCEFCQTLSEQVFAPMALGGMYEGKAMLLRHVGIDEPGSIPGFDGKPLNKAKWAYELGADLTPTTLFLDGQGREIAPRIVGISNIELFTGLIHRNLNIAYAKLGNPLRLPATPELYEQQLKAQTASQPADKP